MLKVSRKLRMFHALFGNSREPKQLSNKKDATVNKLRSLRLLRHFKANGQPVAPRLLLLNLIPSRHFFFYCF